MDVIRNEIEDGWESSIYLGYISEKICRQNIVRKAFIVEK
jgi:hypothetical protein